MLEKFFGKLPAQVNGEKNLITLALTHPSYTKEKGELDSLENYERLEFFGDSVLKLFTSKLLYEAYPDYPEGKLSKIRSILVSDLTLSKIAFQIGLDNLIILGPAEEKQGGRKRESNLACSLEALLGAYYLSGKQKAVEKFILKYVLPYASDIDEHFEKYNAKHGTDYHVEREDPLFASRLYKFKPDVIFISAGFDGHENEFINQGYMLLQEYDYGFISQEIQRVANKYSHGRVISVLEGGYNVRTGLASSFVQSAMYHALFLNYELNKELLGDVLLTRFKREREYLFKIFI